MALLRKGTGGGEGRGKKRGKNTKTNKTEKDGEWEVRLKSWKEENDRRCGESERDSSCTSSRANDGRADAEAASPGVYILLRSNVVFQ